MKTQVNTAINATCDAACDARLIAAALLAALEKAGESICDAEISQMVKEDIIRDAAPEDGDTETGIAMLVLTYLQDKLLNDITAAINKAKGV